MGSSINPLAVSYSGVLFEYAIYICIVKLLVLIFGEMNQHNICLKKSEITSFRGLSLLF